MAKKKTVRKPTISEMDERLNALETGLRGLRDVSKDLAEVRANLRRYLDDAERMLGHFPRRIVREAAKTRRR
jgi:acetate kinase